jgi:hypothetical protein
LIEEEKTIDVKELFLSKLESIDNIVGLAPDTLNTLAKLGEAINNDSNFYQNLIKDLSFKANTADTYRNLETFSDKGVNCKMAQGQIHLNRELALKANVLDTYTRATIDGYIEALRDETTTKLGLAYTKEQVLNAYEVNTNFTLTHKDYNTKLALKSDITSVYTTTQVDDLLKTSDIYFVEAPLEKLILDHPFQAGTIIQLGLSSNFKDLVNAKEPEFITVSPMLNNLTESGKIELMLSSDFTDLVNAKPSEEQVRTLVSAYDPYVLECPLEKGRSLVTGEYVIIMDMSDGESLNAKADKAALNLLEANTILRLGGYLTPNKIYILSDVFPQMIIRNISEATVPCEIAFNRQINNEFLASAFGRSGNTTRGAYWWAGGTDRIRIDCETGSAKIKNGIEGPIMAADSIRATTAEEITVEDNMIITGNLTVQGTMFAENSNPFWAAGRFSGGTLNKIVSSGIYDFNVERVAGFAAGVYRLSFNAHPRGANYITNATASAIQCGVMGDSGYTPTSTEVILFSKSASGVLTDSEMNFMVLA